jgi:hypothetical protein
MEPLSKPGFENVRLSKEQEAKIWLELSEMMLDKSLSALASECLDNISEDLKSEKAYLIKIKSKML